MKEELRQKKRKQKNNKTIIEVKLTRKILVKLINPSRMIKIKKSKLSVYEMKGDTTTDTSDSKTIAIQYYEQLNTSEFESK